MLVFYTMDYKKHYGEKKQISQFLELEILYVLNITQIFSEDEKREKVSLLFVQFIMAYPLYIFLSP